MRSPLAWLSLLGAGGALLSAGRWALGARADALGRPIGFPGLTVGLLLVLAAVSAWGPLRTWQLERALSAAATQVAGVPAAVRCQGLGGAFVDAGNAAGHVVGRADGTMDDVAHVDWEMCRRLRSYIRKDGADPSPEEVVAVHLVSHEARHVAGNRDEASTECEAVQRDVVTARALGASDADARELALRYWGVHYPRMPAGYVSAECKPGGRLDEALPTSPWTVVASSG